MGTRYTELYRSCLIIWRCSGGPQTCNSPALLPCSVKSGHWLMTQLCQALQWARSLESMPASCQLWEDRQQQTIGELLWHKKQATSMLSHQNVYSGFALTMWVFERSVLLLSCLQALLQSWQPELSNALANKSWELQKSPSQLNSLPSSLPSSASFQGDIVSRRIFTWSSHWFFSP